MIPKAVRVAVISDIHANLHALSAVLRDVDAASPDEVWCLGDTVGYGPRPNECADLVRERTDVCLIGNHDLAALGELDLAAFAPDAAIAARWTAAELTPGTRALLEALDPAETRSGVSLFHGSAREPVWEYVLTEESALATLERAGTQLALVGHSHVALAICFEGDVAAEGGLAPAGTTHDLTRGRWILNPGSVGQPRDGDPRAAWLLLDVEGRFGEFRRVPYSVEQTQEELRQAGLPDALADRLSHGN
jgi:predicted phosphodiesterase